jgi:riboflavin synthase
MFTGIVEGTGTVRSAARRGDVMTARIDVGGLFEGLPLGGSVAINGCCLTAVRSDAQGFDVDLTDETLRRTRFDERLVPGALVNLERPMKADGRFDGHVVQGHVDGVGRVVELKSLGESAEIRVEAPPELARYLVEKGSVALDGISLTVYGIAAGAFSVALIPYTLQVTNLKDARPGSLVNLEADVIAKYVERLLAARGL